MICLVEVKEIDNISVQTVKNVSLKFDWVERKYHRYLNLQDNGHEKIWTEVLTTHYLESVNGDLVKFYRCPNYKNWLENWYQKELKEREFDAHIYFIEHGEELGITSKEEIVIEEAAKFSELINELNTDRDIYMNLFQILEQNTNTLVYFGRCGNPFNQYTLKI